MKRIFGWTPSLGECSCQVISEGCTGETFEGRDQPASDAGPPPILALGMTGSQQISGQKRRFLPLSALFASGPVLSSHLGQTFIETSVLSGRER